MMRLRTNVEVGGNTGGFILRQDVGVCAHANGPELVAVGQAAGGGGNFLVAARGWRHPAWVDNFYPQGLPEDWQLSYYSNEFRAVVVPADTWANADTLEVASWQEDTDEAFRFFLEVTDLYTGWGDFSARIFPLAGQFGGVLLRPAHYDADLGQLAPALQQAQRWGPVAVILPPGMEPSERGRHLLEAAGVNAHWPMGGERPRWLPGRLALALTDETPRTPRQWREVVENCLGFGVDSDTVLLMMEGEAPDIEALRVTMMIADMLPATEALR